MHHRHDTDLRKVVSYIRLNIYLGVHLFQLSDSTLGDQAPPKCAKRFKIQYVKHFPHASKLLRFIKCIFWPIALHPSAFPTWRNNFSLGELATHLSHNIIIVNSTDDAQINGCHSPPSDTDKFDIFLYSSRNIFRL